MAAGTNPIFVATPNVGNAGAFPAIITAANTAYDGTGTVTTVFTAGANGSFISRIRFQPMGTNVATLARLFLNNGSTNATATNNAMFWDQVLPSSTSSNTLAMPFFEYTINMAIPAGYKINATIATAVSAGILVVAFGADY